MKNLLPYIMWMFHLTVLKILVSNGELKILWVLLDHINILLFWKINWIFHCFCQKWLLLLFLTFAVSVCLIVMLILSFFLISLSLLLFVILLCGSSVFSLVWMCFRIINFHTAAGWVEGVPHVFRLFHPVFQFQSLLIKFELGCIECCLFICFY